MAKKRRSTALILSYPVEAFRIAIGKTGYIKKADMYRAPCAFCGKPTGLKTAGEINKQTKNSGGIFCKASCKRGEVIPCDCLICGGPIKSKSKKNGKWAKYCSKECYATWQKTENNSNENNPNWKGGYKDRDRKTRKYKEWRTAVFERDNYTCVKCNKRAGELVAHHLYCWSKYISLRFIVSNGATLCKGCHKWIHSLCNSSSLYIEGVKANTANVCYK